MIERGIRKGSTSVLLIMSEDCIKRFITSDVNCIHPSHVATRLLALQKFKVSGARFPRQKTVLKIVLRIVLKIVLRFPTLGILRKVSS